MRLEGRDRLDGQSTKIRLSHGSAVRHSFPSAPRAPLRLGCGGRTKRSSPFADGQRWRFTAQGVRLDRGERLLCRERSARAPPCRSCCAASPLARRSVSWRMAEDDRPGKSRMNTDRASAARCSRCPTRRASSSSHASLLAMGVELISTGGTATALSDGRACRCGRRRAHRLSRDDGRPGEDAAPEGARRPARVRDNAEHDARRCRARHRADRSRGGQPLPVRGDRRQAAPTSTSASRTSTSAARR